MNVFTCFSVSLVVLVCAGCSQPVSADAKSEMPSGTIKLSSQSDGGGYVCGIPTTSPPAEPGTRYKVSFDSDNHQCDNDKYNYIQLDNVPSATRLGFDSDYCEQDNREEWVFSLHTTKHPTTTILMYIPTILASTVGTIIAPGVVLDRKVVGERGDGIGELSCVEVLRSALP